MPGFDQSGIYWVPLYDLLTAQGIRVVIANPLRVKQIPGRTTDTTDSEWLCKLLLNGLVYRSFIPDTQKRTPALCIISAHALFGIERPLQHTPLSPSLLAVGISFVPKPAWHNRPNCFYAPLLLPNRLAQPEKT